MNVTKLVPVASTINGRHIEDGRETTEHGSTRLEWILVKDQLIMEATDDEGNVIDQYAVSVYEIMGHMIQARRDAMKICKHCGRGIYESERSKTDWTHYNGFTSCWPKGSDGVVVAAEPVGCEVHAVECQCGARLP